MGDVLVKCFKTILNSDIGIVDLDLLIKYLATQFTRRLEVLCRLKIKTAVDKTSYFDVVFC